jgi:hypothetical protein
MALKPLAIPDEDSDDLSDAEIAKSIPIEVYSEVISHIPEKCLICESSIAHVKHTRRRRKPAHFSRVTVKCEAGHETSQLFLLKSL